MPRTRIQPVPIATLVTRLHATGRTLPTFSANPDQAWRALRSELALPAPEPNDGEAVIPSRTHANGHAGPFTQGQWATPLPRYRGGRLLNQLATAALVLLTLAAGFVAIAPRLPESPEEGRWVPAFARALQAAPGVVDTPLIETMFTPAELPSGEKEATFYQLTIPPGVNLSYLGGPYCGCRDETITAGVGMEIVQAGAYTVRLQAPLRVQRAGSSRPDEVIPAGTAVTLTAGDAVIYPNYAAPGDIGNPGDEPVKLTGVLINATEASGTPLPIRPSDVRATMLAHSIGSDWARFPPGPLHLSLRKVTLPGGTEIGPYQLDGLQAFHVESGTMLRNFLPAGETAPRGRPLPILSGSTAPFMVPTAGLRETIATDDGRPAELLVLIIEPEVSSVQSLTP